MIVVADSGLLARPVGLALEDEPWAADCSGSMAEGEKLVDGDTSPWPDLSGNSPLPKRPPSPEPQDQRQSDDQADDCVHRKTVSKTLPNAPDLRQPQSGGC